MSAWLACKHSSLSTSNTIKCFMTYCILLLDFGRSVQKQPLQWHFLFFYPNYYFVRFCVLFAWYIEMGHFLWIIIIIICRHWLCCLPIFLCRLIVLYWPKMDSVTCKRVSKHFGFAFLNLQPEKKMGGSCGNRSNKKSTFSSLRLALVRTSSRISTVKIYFCLFFFSKKKFTTQYILKRAKTKTLCLQFANIEAKLKALDTLNINSQMHRYIYFSKILLALCVLCCAV